MSDKPESYDRAKGIVLLTLNSGSAIPKMDCDPYVVIQIGNCPPRKSAIQKNTLNPVWNEEMEVGYTHIDEMCAVSLWDYDKITGDDLIGTVKFALKDYPLDFEKRNIILEFPEIKKTKPKINLVMQFEVLLK